LRQALELQTVPDYSTLLRLMLRVQEQVIAQVLAEVVRRFQSRKPPAPDKAKSTVAVDATGLAPGAISTFFIRRLHLDLHPRPHPALHLSATRSSPHLTERQETLDQ